MIMGVYLDGGQAHGGVRCPLTPNATKRPRSASVSRPSPGLLFLHLPLALIVLYAFTTEERASSSRRRATRPMVRSRLGPAGHLAAALSLARVWRSIDGACARLRHARRRRAVARQVLRPRDDLAPLRAADRTARHHHRYLSTLGLRHHGHRFLDLDHRPRARDVLHRRRLQQCHRPLQAAVGV